MAARLNSGYIVRINSIPSRNEGLDDLFVCALTPEYAATLLFFFESTQRKLYGGDATTEHDTWDKCPIGQVRAAPIARTVYGVRKLFDVRFHILSDVVLHASPYRSRSQMQLMGIRRVKAAATMLTPAKPDLSKT